MSVPYSRHPVTQPIEIAFFYIVYHDFLTGAFERVKEIDEIREYCDKNRNISSKVPDILCAFLRTSRKRRQRDAWSFSTRFILDVTCNCGNNFF